MSSSIPILRIAFQLPKHTCPASRPLLKNARIRNLSTSNQRFQSILPRTRRGDNLNPLDRASVKTSIDNDWRRVKLLAAATVACMALTYAVASIYPQQPGTLKADAGQNIPDEFQGKPVIVTAGGAKVLAHDEKTGEDIELVPTGTSTIPHFPRTIKLPAADASSSEAEYTLVGLGIRTVSFLSIQVYVVGLYVQTASLAALQKRFIRRVNPIASTLIAGEKDTLRRSLLDADESYEMWDELLRDTQGFESAFRIVPTRGTDFNHLRDGWVRGITNRTQAAAAQKQGAGAGGAETFADEQFGASMREFNALFKQKGKAPKGSAVILTRDGAGRLGLLFSSKDRELESFGTVEDERISRLIWLNYLGGKGVSSEDARRRIVDGVIELVERPVGTAALKVT